MEDALKEKRWTDYLKSLHLGNYSKMLESIEDMDSLASVGYRLNRQCYEKQFKFSLNYADKIISICVTRRNK